MARNALGVEGIHVQEGVRSDGMLEWKRARDKEVKENGKEGKRKLEKAMKGAWKV